MRRTLVHNARADVIEGSTWAPFLPTRRAARVIALETPLHEAEEVAVQSSSGRRYRMRVASLLSGYQRVAPAADPMPGVALETSAGEAAPADELGPPLPNALRKLPDDGAADPAALLAMSLREIDGWTLGTLPGEAEPLIRDLELGERLAFDRPRDVRKLIERLTAAGKLNDSELRATMAQTGGRPARELWLTEEQALMVVTASETPKAIALTREIVRVFMAARRGQLVAAVASPPAFPSPTPPDPRVDRLLGAVEALVGVVGAILPTLQTVVGERAKLTTPSVPEATPAQRPAAPTTLIPRGWVSSRVVAAVISDRRKRRVSVADVGRAIDVLKLRERPDMARHAMVKRTSSGVDFQVPRWAYAPAAIDLIEGHIFASPAQQTLRV